MATTEMMFWAYGYGIKPDAALDECARVLGVSPTQVRPSLQAFPDFAAATHRRLVARWSSVPTPTLRFHASTLAEATGGVVIRCRERGVKARQVVLEDHGVRGFIFMGRDGISMNTLPTFARAFSQLREALTSDAELVLLHCQAAADSCVLARAISGLVGCPVIAMDVDQTIGNQQHEGNAYRVTPGRSQLIGSLDRAVLHFD